ncbi:iron chaperone [Salinicoccus halitifaciens]|uniref:Uncharacterized protein YdhG (YjbR/CyaY superfamily) n=1 Tax=Salinicoccus halitifaciens TaxID=1073415 RepID=A0ABV2EAD3_9STAP|nr:DUF1801 domain-containing protein [Salinicoccus halitifaciens]MCD2138521.1 DUF1801 domain-containing protein [Salinicoccus halitifaciens]
METFEDYIRTIEDSSREAQFKEIISWIDSNYPELEQEVKWNTPMYTSNGTFILGIDSSKKHISISPEEKTMEFFTEEIEEAGYSQTKGLFRIKYSDEVDYGLLKKMIDYNIEDKKDYDKFWR